MVSYEMCIRDRADPFISQFPEGYDTYIEQGGTNVSGCLLYTSRCV